MSAFRTGRFGFGYSSRPFQICEKATLPQSWVHFRPQYEFICDDDGGVLVDFVGRFERLEEDWAEVCKIAGASCRLGHFREGRHEDYRTYYSAEQVEELRQIYAKDIKLFGYEFGGLT